MNKKTNQIVTELSPLGFGTHLPDSLQYPAIHSQLYVPGSFLHLSFFPVHKVGSSWHSSLSVNKNNTS